MEDGRRNYIHEGISADDEVRNLRVRLQLCQDFRKQLMKQLADMAAEYEMKLEDTQAQERETFQNTILRVNKDHEMMVSRIREEHEQELRVIREKAKQDRDSIQERGNLLLQQTEEEYEAKLRELEGKNSHLQTQLAAKPRFVKSAPTDSGCICTCDTCQMECNYRKSRK